MTRLPHPIPYQGSKRNLAAAILGVVGNRCARLFEPFAGSAALSLAASSRGTADRFVIGDSLVPLIGIWSCILKSPSTLAKSYAEIWNGQEDSDENYYASVREEFNRTKDPARLLYLLARCVKNSPRWNREGLFNQSQDKRRLGMRPEKMTHQLAGAHALLHGKTETVAGDFAQIIEDAGPRDLVYLDPPWEGTSTGRDTRYHSGLARERLIAVLETLNQRGVPWLLSYDGQCGAKTYGTALPADLRATRLELNAGRSSQATLNGRSDVTIESLYVSPALASSGPRELRAKPTQTTLFGSGHA